MTEYKRIKSSYGIPGAARNEEVILGRGAIKQSYFCIDDDQRINSVVFVKVNP